MTILGTVASSTRQGLVTGSYESIATYTLSSPQSAVTFSSIPSTYKHLQVRISARNNRSVGDQASGFWEANGDTNNGNYTTYILSGNGTSTLSCNAYGTGSYTGLSTLTPSSNVTSVQGVIIYDFLDYANTNKYKTARCMNGWEVQGTGSMYYSSNLWLSFNAITSLSFTVPGYNWSTNSKFALYGIKGA